MIKIVSQIKGDRVIALRASGHAGYDDYDRDIVCSSVSTLMITAVNALEKLAGLGAKDIDLEYRADDGILGFTIPDDLDTEIMNRTELILRTVLIGLEGARDEYPEYIDLSYRRCM